MTKSSSSDDDHVTIKKYANRRLYNTATSSYVTLDDLATMVKAGEDFKVFDAKSGDDITRSVLTQIIFEEEAKGQNLLPVKFLRQLIRFYDDNMKVFVPSFLEMSMENFARNQDDMRSRFEDAFDADTTYRNFEEQVRQNMSIFQNTMRAFSPFGMDGDAGAKPVQEPAPKAKPAEKTAEKTGANSVAPTEISELKEQLASMQELLNKLVKD